ncbi:hypothetical protein [Methylobacterium sp. B1]|uniref:hypothetical protein n=1 Tax=Methylobacterium sp. B1 TaxID=91459 RepID=UPI0011D19C31|nr:hypothetical protein [Methylobacterium sp. B1]
MTSPEAVLAIVHDAVARMREQSTRNFRNHWPFTVEVKMNNRKAHVFIAEAQTWLEANCSGNWTLRLDIDVVGFDDEAEAVAFALFSAP